MHVSISTLFYVLNQSKMYSVVATSSLLVPCMHVTHAEDSRECPRGNPRYFLINQLQLLLFCIRITSRTAPVFDQHWYQPVGGYRKLKSKLKNVTYCFCRNEQCFDLIKSFHKVHIYNVRLSIVCLEHQGPSSSTFQQSLWTSLKYAVVKEEGCTETRV